MIRNLFLQSTGISCLYQHNQLPSTTVHPPDLYCPIVTLHCYFSAPGWRKPSPFCARLAAPGGSPLAPAVPLPGPAPRRRRENSRGRTGQRGAGGLRRVQGFEASLIKVHLRVAQVVPEPFDPKRLPDLPALVAPKRAETYAAHHPLAGRLIPGPSGADGQPLESRIRRPRPRSRCCISRPPRQTSARPPHCAYTIGSPRGLR